jgi:hypothetical protein
MRFFRRDSGPADGEAIDTFWHWWSEERDAIAAAIADRTLDRWVEPIGRQVGAIDRRLAWELSAGATAQHALVVTPEGDPAVRPRALDWLAAAPPVDATWEYHAARQPRDLGTLEIGGLSVDLTEFRAIAGWDEGRERLDVRLWHPALATAPQNLGLQTSFLYLDTLLGEEDVERWVGEIDVLDDPTGGRTPDELRAEVQRRAAEATGASWALATMQDGRDAAVVVLNLAVKPIDHPYCQHHLTVTVARGLEQLAGPGEAEAAKLDEAEDRLAADLAPADAVHLGRITRRRDREFHFMVRDPEAARAIAAAWAGSQPQWSPRINVRADPAWEVRRQLGM